MTFKEWAQRTNQNEVLPIAPGQKNPLYKNWTDEARRVTDQDIENWDASNYNIGLRTKFYPAVDIDIDNPEFVNKLINKITRLVGRCSIRRREGSNRVLLLFSTKTPFKKKVIKSPRLDGGTVEGKIEILCDGQQCVVEGMHPSGGKYYWDDSLLMEGDKYYPEVIEKHFTRLITELGGEDDTSRGTVSYEPTDHKLDKAIKDIVSGANYNDSLCTLTMHLIDKRYSPYLVKTTVMGIMNQAANKDTRWQDRIHHVDRLIADGYKKQLVPLKLLRRTGSIKKATFTELEFPPGLTGEIAKNILQFMRYPSKEIAILGALHVVSVLAGRRFSCMGKPLTAKRILLAEQGRGKDTINKYLQQIVQYLTRSSEEQDLPRVAQAQELLISGDFTSPKPLHMSLVEFATRSFIFSEAGQGSDTKSGDPGPLRSHLLQILSANEGQAIPLKNYSQGKNEDNIPYICDVAAIFLYESTPAKYIEVLKNNFAFTSGELARADLIYVDPTIREINRYHHKATLPKELAEKFVRLAKVGMTSMFKGSDPLPESQKIFIEYENEELADSIYSLEEDIVRKRNSTQCDIEKSLLARHIERLQLNAQVLAIADSINYLPEGVPVITAEHVNWVNKYLMVIQDTITALSETGELANNEMDAVIDQVDKLLQKYIDDPSESMYKYDPKMSEAREFRYMAHTVLSKHLKHGAYSRYQASLTGGAKRYALSNVMQEMQDRGEIEIIDRKKSQELGLGINGVYYRVLRMTEKESNN